MQLGRGITQSGNPKTSTSHGPTALIPVPSRWMSVEVVAERVNTWQASSRLEGRSLPPLPPEMEAWAALTPQGPVLILATAAWGQEWDPGRTCLHQLQGTLQERPSWIHLLQLEPLEDKTWLLLASNLGDLYMKV